MPLQLESISKQVQIMAQEMADRAPVERQMLERAQELLCSIRADALLQKLEAQRLQHLRIPWLVASPQEAPGNTITAPQRPQNFSVIGGDGSSIPPDRHGPARFYVLNAGYAALTYGDHPDAFLESEGHLYFRDEDLYLLSERRESPVEGALLGTRMEIESLRFMSQALQVTARPAVALRDGPLILWTLQNESSEVQQKLLGDFLAFMDIFRDAAVGLAGYISRSDARDVVNSLRVWLCEGQPDACERCNQKERDFCLALATLRDRDLFSFLAEGERSGIFESSSEILRQYHENRVEFFYLNVGGEIARLEVPQWVTAQRQLLDLVHTLTVDQCQRSTGFPPYPPCLLEAHEQAVITASSRQLVQDMVAQALVQHGQTAICSAKDDSKRRRGV